MIQQYRLTFSSSIEKVAWHSAYALYAELLKKLPPESTQLLHGDGFKPISHYAHMPEPHRLEWVVSIFGDDFCNMASEPLLSLKEANIWGEVSLSRTGFEQSIIDESVLVKESLSSVHTFSKIHFITPCTFRTEGNYAIFPSVRLIMRHLAARWSDYFRQYNLQDDDALNLLCQGVYISGYRLKSAGYRLKEQHIPGFVGELNLATRLSAPMSDVFRMLMAFAPYSGIGIKTALGMGGVCVDHQLT